MAKTIVIHHLEMVSDLSLIKWANEIRIDIKELQEVVEEHFSIMGKGAARQEISTLKRQLAIIAAEQKRRADAK
jgi:hypothetical protein